MKRLLFAVLLVFPAAVQAQIVTGTAKVLDGDTLQLGGERIRLHGIDALEAGQTCIRDGKAWGCGQDAAALLARFADGQTVNCRQQDRDSYQRIVASCRVGELDLAQVVVEAGLAVALPDFSDAYVETEARVRQRGIGMWGAEFETPANYRKAHPRQFAPARPEVSRAPTVGPRAIMPQQRRSGAGYANCAQARAAGAAPIYRGQPGYRPELDGDSDGIACEPYWRRR